MNRKTILYIAMLILILGSFIAAEVLLPDKTDWRESYSASDKIPNGCFVIHKMLPQIFPAQNITKNIISLFELVGDTIADTHTCLLIITYNFNPDHSDLAALLKYIRSGNTVFISAVAYGRGIEDTLNLHTLIYNPFNSSLSGYPFQFYPKNARRTKGYDFKRQFTGSWFSSVDTLNSLALGTDSIKNINFFSMALGKGVLYLHSQPHVFTNDNLLYDDKEYAAAVLSFLPIQPVIWDEYYKPDRGSSASPMRYILKSQSLKLAYYLLLSSVLLYIIFEGRRRQRIIPVIPPLSNSSMEFTRTIARLYYFRENHADLVQKKFSHFREFLFDKYFIPTAEMNEEWIAKIAVKSAVSEDIINEIARKYKLYCNSSLVNKRDLLDFNKSIEDFYKKAKNK